MDFFEKKRYIFLKKTLKKSSYASNKIEGNPLTEEQANEAIERDEHRHL